MKKTILFHIEKFITISFLISIISFVASNLVIYFWKRDGFDFIELSVLSILSSFIVLIVILIVDSVMLSKYYKSCVNEQINFLKNIFQILILTALVIGFSLFFDWALFSIDNSVSLEYAESLRQFLIDQHADDQVAGIDEFAELPFLIQNIFLFSFFVLLSVFISVWLAKRKFLKTKIVD